MMGFDQGDCGITGPMTNQPGHQPHQMVPINDPVRFIEYAKSKKVSNNGYRLDYVNGFCFMLKKDRLVMFDEEHLFDPNLLHYGGEDEYQKRMRDGGMFAYAMDDSLVFHFKDVSLESWKDGRVRKESLAKRLKENVEVGV